MSKKTRDAGKRDPDAPWFTYPAPEAEAPAKPSKRQDPVALMATAMVRRAFETIEGITELAQRPAAVCAVLVPSEAWLVPVSRAWQEEALGTESRCLIGHRLRPDRPDHLLDAEVYHCCIFRWEEDDQDKKWTSKRSAEEIAGIGVGLNLGLPVWAFASSIDQIPPEMVTLADVIVTLPPPDRKLVSEVADTLCGTYPYLAIDDATCARIEPGTLWLAMRPGQSADDFVGRLNRLLPPPPEKPKTGVTLDDVGGMAEAVAWGRDLVRDLEDYKAGRVAWADVDPGLLIHGAPGVGKTFFARALANSCGVELIATSLSQWQAAGHLGDLLKVMRRDFRRARESAPCILFLDEFDSYSSRAELATANADHRSYHTQVINGLLEEMDGTAAREGVVILAACNDPSHLDPALLRSGRLDRHIAIPMPDIQELAKIFRMHLGGDLDGVDLMPLAEKADGHTGADVKRFVRGAKRRGRAERRAIEMADLEAEMHTARPRPLSDEALWRCAVHEAGHAVFLCLERPGALVCATVKATRAEGGFTYSRATDGRILTQSDVEMTTRQLLSGRAAEEVVLGDPSSGAGGPPGSDLAAATVIVANAISSLGLFSGDALAWRGEVDAGGIGHLLRFDIGFGREVNAVLHAQYELVLAMMRERETVVKRVAKMVLERETLTGAEVAAMVEGKRRRRAAK